MAKTVRDAMTPNPRSVSRSTSVVIAAHMMEDEDVGSLPVVDNDDFLVGIVTDRDIALRVVAAGDILTENPISAYPDEPLDEALEHMAYRRVRRLPVVDSDRLIGMLAQADVVHEVKEKKAGHLVEEISQPAKV